MPFGETVATVADIAGARVRMTGSTTGREAYMLVNSAADFSAVGNGWLVVNTTTGKATYAEKPINTGGGTYRKLQLREDIFTASSGENYEILRPGRLIIRPPYGYEPNIRVIRWAALPYEPDPTIYGIELWVTNGLTPAALVEKTTRKLVSGTEGVYPGLVYPQDECRGADRLRGLLPADVPCRAGDSKLLQAQADRVLVRVEQVSAHRAQPSPRW
jgi:hypothetical protein